MVPGFRRIDYWAEESNIPLYVLSDRRQPPFYDDFLCLYKDGASRLYFLNDRWEVESRNGFDAFSRRDFLDTYADRTERILREFKALDSLGADSDFFGLIEVLRAWQEIYFQTEAVRMERVKPGGDGISEADLRRVAELRLRLRMSAEDALFKRSDDLLATIAQRHEMTVDDLLFYGFVEMRDLLERGGKVDPVGLEERKRGYAFWRESGDSHLEVGPDFQKIWEDLRVELVPEETSEIRGAVAHAGTIRGEVQLIRHDRFDIRGRAQRFKDGCILVTEMTRPQTIVACRKAKAIITDEGGVTCHAAIFSREMGIPCIIGTKIATKVLKTGDLVEVDADRGVVRVLERAE